MGRALHGRNQPGASRRKRQVRATRTAGARTRQTNRKIRGWAARRVGPEGKTHPSAKGTCTSFLSRFCVRAGSPGHFLGRALKMSGSFPTAKGEGYLTLSTTLAVRLPKARRAFQGFLGRPGRAPPSTGAADRGPGTLSQRLLTWRLAPASVVGRSGPPAPFNANPAARRTGLGRLRAHGRALGFSTERQVPCRLF